VVCPHPITSTTAQESFEIVKSLRCETFEGGHNTLQSDFRIDCDGARYRNMVAYSSVMVFVYPVGIPLVTLLMLARLKDRIYPKNEGRMLKVRPSLSCTQPLSFAPPPKRAASALGPSTTWWLCGGCTGDVRAALPACACPSCLPPSPMCSPPAAYPLTCQVLPPKPGVTVQDTVVVLRLRHLLSPRQFSDLKAHVKACVFNMVELRHPGLVLARNSVAMGAATTTAAAIRRLSVQAR
jgi:hypothetical protein